MYGRSLLMPFSALLLNFCHKKQEILGVILEEPTPVGDCWS